MLSILHLFFLGTVKSSGGIGTPEDMAPKTICCQGAQRTTVEEMAVSVEEALDYGMHSCASTELLKSLQWQD